MTQQELADKLHISRSTVSKIESGHVEITAKLFRDWAIVTQNEFNAAMVMFGTDFVSHLTTLTQVIQFIRGF